MAEGRNNLVLMRGNTVKKESTNHTNHAQKLKAIQIVQYLPDNKEEAMHILQLAGLIVTDWLNKPETDLPDPSSPENFTR